MALSGLLEIPWEAVYLNHEAQASGLGKQAQVGVPTKKNTKGLSLTVANQALHLQLECANHGLISI